MLEVGFILPGGLRNEMTGRSKQEGQDFCHKKRSGKSLASILMLRICEQRQGEA